MTMLVSRWIKSRLNSLLYIHFYYTYFFFDFEINQNQNFLWFPKASQALGMVPIVPTEALIMNEELRKQNVTGYESILRNFKCVTLSKFKKTMCPPVSFSVE